MPEIPEKEMKKVQIKIKFMIDVKNVSEVPGKATEITDNIPEGLIFNEEDNKEWGWKVAEGKNGVVTTDHLKDEILDSEETVTMPLFLTWDNSKGKTGEIVNIALITKTENEPNIPDVNPDNDKDDAPIIVAVKTGEARTYIGLISIILITFSTGISLIKKYVLE